MQVFVLLFFKLNIWHICIYDTFHNKKINIKDKRPLSDGEGCRKKVKSPEGAGKGWAACQALDLQENADQEPAQNLLHIYFCLSSIFSFQRLPFPATQRGCLVGM